MNEDHAKDGYIVDRMLYLTMYANEAKEFAAKKIPTNNLINLKKVLTGNIII